MSRDADLIVMWRCRRTYGFSLSMAGSRYAYVRDYELSDVALPNTFLVIRIDGKGFHKCVRPCACPADSFRFSERHGFVKPNDPLALELMNEAARCVMQEFKGQITLAFGESDEYRLVSTIRFPSNHCSFLIDRKSTLYNRRQRWVVPRLIPAYQAQQTNDACNVPIHCCLRIPLAENDESGATNTPIF